MMHFSPANHAIDRSGDELEDQSSAYDESNDVSNEGLEDECNVEFNGGYDGDTVEDGSGDTSTVRSWLNEFDWQLLVYQDHHK